MISKFLVFSISLLSFVCGEDVLSKNVAENFASPQCESRNERHFAINTRGCAWFWYCNDKNVALSQNRCPVGYSFNYADQTCDYKENVDCDLDDRVIDYTCPRTGFVTYIPHPQSCSLYTVCFNDIENDRECEPAGTHFSFYDQACVDPFLADCKIEEQKCAESIATGLPVFLPNLRDCNSFFVCTNETSTILRCAPGYHYVPSLSRCEEIANTNCTSLIPDDSIIIPDLTFTDCVGKHGESLPHPDSCQFYFLCLADKSYLQSCGNELVFDTETHSCRVQSEALCIFDVVTDPPTTTEEETTTVEETTEESTTTIEEETTISEDTTTSASPVVL